MRKSFVFLCSTGALAAVMLTGCAEHRYRTYDPYYHDYHSWNSGEGVYYRQWMGERHYNYVEYNRLDHDRQHEYWEWRHKHGDHDRDDHRNKDDHHRNKDRDRDHDRDHDRDRD